jgi:secondary thiamine-phosphate synthase enzyme
MSTASAATAFAEAAPDPSRWTLVHEIFRLKTRRSLQFVDLTDRIGSWVWRAGIETGLVTVQTRHTTAGLAINEHEPLLLEDLRLTLERYAPATVQYAHDDLVRRTVNVMPLEPPNGHAHCKALALRASETVHVLRGRLFLGRWQRIFLIELDGGRPREVSVMAMGQARGSGH